MPGKYENSTLPVNGPCLLSVKASSLGDWMKPVGSVPCKGGAVSKVIVSLRSARRVDAPLYMYNESQSVETLCASATILDLSIVLSE